MAFNLEQENARHAACCSDYVTIATVSSIAFAVALALL